MYPELSAKHQARRLAPPKGPGPPELIELGEEMADYMAESWHNRRSEFLQQQQNQELRRLNRNLEAMQRQSYSDW
jgi:hypothetical protein